MWQYFLRRFLLAILTFFLSTLVVFLIIQKAPGGPVEQARLRIQMGGAAGGEGGLGSSSSLAQTQISEDAIKALERYYELDKPIPVRYVKWLGKLLRFDLGSSYRYGIPVWDLICERFPISITFGLVGFLLSYIVCIPLGIAKAIRHGTHFDFATSAFVFIGYSLPGWAVGLVLLMAFGGGNEWGFDWFPLAGWRPSGWNELDLWGKIKGQVHHAALPILCYSIGSFATLTVLTKNTLLESLGQDYVRTAFAKGLSEPRVIIVHAMRNSLIPLATGLAHSFSLILAGSFLIEKVFTIHGMGWLGYMAVLDKDQNIVMGTLVIGVGLQLLGNMLQDLLYSVFDPRIRFR